MYSFSNSIRKHAPVAFVSLAVLTAGFLMSASTTTLAESSGGVSMQVAQNQVDQKTQKKALKAYSRSGYGYCDAKKVASVWGIGTSDAKIVIGQKIRNGITNLVDADIASTNGRVNCSWEETDFSYEDAVALGEFWARPAHEAKLKVEQITSEMGTKRAREELRRNGARV